MLFKSAIDTSLIDFKTIQKAEELITNEGLKNSSAKLFPVGTLLMAMYGQGKTRGKVAILGIEASTNQACGAIIPNTDIVVMLLGVGSAVVDNVPLVAASMGMFQEPMDSPLWHFVAFSAGTGGSMLIIGSAAGVVAMGMEKIDFFWYFKKIAWLAAVGFIVGSIAFIGLRSIL